MTESRDTSLGIQTLAGSAAMATQQILGFGSAVVLGYLVGPGGFGGFYLMMAIVEIADAPIQGWSGAAKKFYAESDTDRSGILGSEILAALSLSVVGIPIVFLFRDQINTATGIENGWLLLTALFVVAVFYRPLHGLLTATGEVAQKEALATVHSVLKFVGQVGLLVLGFGVTGMVVGYVAASLLVLPISLLLLRRIPVWPTRETLLELFGFAKYSVVTALVHRTFNRFDLILLGALTTPAIVGYYEAGFKLTTPAFLVSSVAASGIMARVSNLDGHGENPTEDILNVLSYASIVAIPIFFGVLALGGPLLVYAFGEGFAEAGIFLLGLAFWRILASQNNVLTSVVTGANYPRKTAIISGGALLINIPLGIVLLYVIGPLGVVIATIVAEATRYVGLIFIVHNRFPDVTPIPKPLCLQFVSGILMYLTVAALRDLLGTNSIVKIGLLVGTGAAVYGIVILCVSAHFRRTVRGILADVST